MRVIIDRDLCRGHAQCMGEVPEVFDVDDSGRLTVLQEHPPQGLAARLEVAARYCPTGAIRIERDDDASIDTPADDATVDDASADEARR